jgi:hypothetical protein
MMSREDLMTEESRAAGVVAGVAFVFIVVGSLTMSHSIVFLGFLINTPLQRGELRRATAENRFNGFPAASETVETVSLASCIPVTPLKRGVNEISRIAPISIECDIVKVGTDRRAVGIGRKESARPSVAPYDRTTQFHFFFVRYVAGFFRTTVGLPAGTNTALPSCHTASGRPSRWCCSTTWATASCSAVNALRVIGFFGLAASFIGSSVGKG